MPFRPPRISRYITKDWTRGSEVKSQYLTVWELWHGLRLFYRDSKFGECLLQFDSEAYRPTCYLKHKDRNTRNCYFTSCFVWIWQHFGGMKKEVRREWRKLYDGKPNTHSENMKGKDALASPKSRWKNMKWGLEKHNVKLRTSNTLEEGSYWNVELLGRCRNCLLAERLLASQAFCSHSTKPCLSLMPSSSRYSY